jgi:molybdopterin converting factor subunit 1
MNVSVRYFALFREQAGCASESVNWPGGTAAKLFQMVSEKHPALQNQAAALVAINDEMSEWETTLNEGDEVLFFPPVAGG